MESKTDRKIPEKERKEAGNYRAEQRQNVTTGWVCIGSLSVSQQVVLTFLHSEPQ